MKTSFLVLFFLIFYLFTPLLLFVILLTFYFQDHLCLVLTVGKREEKDLNPIIDIALTQYHKCFLIIPFNEI